MRALPILLIAASLAACGGDDDINVGGLSCGTTPCGGDPVGVWTIGGTCVSGAASSEDCPEATFTSSVEQTGTVEVNADMTYSVDVTTAGVSRGTIPISCFQGLLTDCSQLNDEEISCEAAGDDACSCTVTINDQTLESGTWSVTGNTITLDDGAGGVDTSDFCVAGDAMSVSMVDEDGVGVEILMTR